jgi:hypothetical protein
MAQSAGRLNRKQSNPVASKDIELSLIVSFGITVYLSAALDL